MVFLQSTRNINLNIFLNIQNKLMANNIKFHFIFLYFIDNLTFFDFLFNIIIIVKESFSDNENICVNKTCFAREKKNGFPFFIFMYTNTSSLSFSGI